MIPKNNDYDRFFELITNYNCEDDQYINLRQAVSKTNSNNLITLFIINRTDFTKLSNDDIISFYLFLHCFNIKQYIIDKVFKKININLPMPIEIIKKNLIIISHNNINYDAIKSQIQKKLNLSECE
jgi:hypothetical protein